MTALNSGTALLILVVFVVPGFIAVLVRERIYEVRGEDSSFDRLLTTVYYSLLAWTAPALAAVIAGVRVQDVETLVHGEAPLWFMGCLALGVLLVFPAAASLAAWAWIRCRLRTTVLRLLGLPPGHRFASAWDFAFDSEEDVLVVVSLRDGQRLAGYFGGRSHCGYARRRRDLFLERQWHFGDDAELAGPSPNNVGLWINADDIVSVERYALPNVLLPAQEQENPAG